MFIIDEMMYLLLNLMMSVLVKQLWHDKYTLPHVITGP